MARYERVVVVGASGFGREALDVLEAMQNVGSPIQIEGVVDDGPSGPNRHRLEARRAKYLGTLEGWLLCQKPSSVRFVLGIGNPQIRERLAVRLQGAGFEPFDAIHPSVVLGTEVRYGKGAVICAGAVLSTNVRLGQHVHINPHGTIGHDSVISDFVSMNPAAVVSGEVRIGERTLVGAGAIVLQGLEIAPDTIIGAGACVTKSTDQAHTLVGVPARAKEVIS